MKKKNTHECIVPRMGAPDKRIASKECITGELLKKKDITEIRTKLKTEDLVGLYGSRRVS